MIRLIYKKLVRLLVGDDTCALTRQSSSSNSASNSSAPHMSSNKNKSSFNSIVLSLCFILIYYLFSISLTFFNRMMFVTYKYPLSITLVHLIVKFTLAIVLRNVYECCRRKKRILLTWSTYFKRIIPTAIASALDIGLSNWSLQYITITLYTMSKSTVILFIFMLALLLRLEKCHYSLILIVLPISSGLFLFTYHSTEFHLFGFILVMLASFLSGLRWTLTQLITQKHELGLSNPIDMIYHIQPSMILSLLPLAFYVESTNVIASEKFFRSNDLVKLSHNLMWILFGAFLAFLLEASEYLVVTYTSSITLSISGIFKEICTIYLAVKLNDNQLNTMNTIGLVVCLLGIVVHVFFKIRQQVDNAKANENSCKKSLMFASKSDINNVSGDEYDGELFEMKNATTAPLLNQNRS